MEKEHSVNNTVQTESDEQISFETMNRDSALSVLEKTNINELTDSECRELLIKMNSLINS